MESSNAIGCTEYLKTSLYPEMSKGPFFVIRPDQWIDPTIDISDYRSACSDHPLRFLSRGKPALRRHVYRLSQFTNGQKMRLYWLTQITVTAHCIGALLRNILREPQITLQLRQARQALQRTREREGNRTREESSSWRQLFCQA